MIIFNPELLGTHNSLNLNSIPSAWFLACKQLPAPNFPGYNFLLAAIKKSTMLLIRTGASSSAPSPHFFIRVQKIRDELPPSDYSYITLTASMWDIHAASPEAKLSLVNLQNLNLLHLPSLTHIFYVLPVFVRVLRRVRGSFRVNQSWGGVAGQWRAAVWDKCKKKMFRCNF